jgi:hypothetical protein
MRREFPKTRALVHEVPESQETRADVAQPVEQRFRKPPVGSSSLPVGSDNLAMTMSKPIPAIDHYDNGKVRFRGANLDGKMHGPWEFFRRDGSRMRSRSFERGKQIGVWRTFDRSGKVLKETEFPGPAPRTGASVKGRRTL